MGSVVAVPITPVLAVLLVGGVVEKSGKRWEMLVEAV